MYSWIRPLLFRLDAERAHKLTLHTLSFMPSLMRLAAPQWTAPASLQQNVWNSVFDHPIGLAAGLDKDGIAVNGLLQCGFSFVEVGTVTPKPQPGNPLPRLFRLRNDEALINRMGFNNHGAATLRRHLQQRRQKGIVGVNLGKNKLTPNEEAAADYIASLNVLYPVADYIVINVSSPNTPGLRDLQAETSLLPLVQAVIQARNTHFDAHRDRVHPHRPPVLVKLAPDLSDDAIQNIGQAMVEAGVDGFVATNTTLSREGLTSPARTETGGLSGKPLRQRSTEVIRLLYQATSGSVPIVGCGGIFTARDAYEKIRAGATLVQIYTGFIYNGPGVVRELAYGLAELLKRDGFASVQEAIGRDA